MTAGSYAAQDRRARTDSDASRCLERIVIAAAASGVLAVLILATGGGLLWALLAYTLGASTLTPLLAVAPHARGIVSTVRHRAVGPRLSRQGS